MQAIKRFLERNQRQLLQILDGSNPEELVGMSALDYVDSVLDSWLDEFGHRRLPAPTDHERTFWYVLYLFEDIAEDHMAAPELPLGATALDADHNLTAYEVKMILDLVRTKELLRCRKALPVGMFATRPGENCDDEEAFAM